MLRNAASGAHTRTAAHAVPPSRPPPSMYPHSTLRSASISADVAAGRSLPVSPTHDSHCKKACNVALFCGAAAACFSADVAVTTVLCISGVVSTHAAGGRGADAAVSAAFDLFSFFSRSHLRNALFALPPRSLVISFLVAVIYSPLARFLPIYFCSRLAEISPTLARGGRGGREEAKEMTWLRRRWRWRRRFGFCVVSLRCSPMHGAERRRCECVRRGAVEAKLSAKRRRNEWPLMQWM